MDKTLGQLAVHYNLISPAELEHCLALQETTDPPRYLGEVMVQEGYFKQITLDRLLGAQRRQERPTGSTKQFGRADVAKRLEGAELGDFLRVQVELEASELHLAAGGRPTARIHGRLVRVHPKPLSPGRSQSLLHSILDETQLAALKRERKLLFHHTEPEAGRFRVTLTAHSEGLAGVFRHIPDSVPALETLNLHPIVTKVPQIRRGLVLVTGPRGSGRTTTLATIVELINRTRPCHVVMIERACEYLIKSATSLVTQREVGSHPGDFAAALRMSLREDPDVLVLGELSTAEHITTALTAAETGHLVLATLNTTNSYHAILRILDATSGRKQVMVRGMLANLLRLVISQQLVPSKTGDRQWLASEVLTVTSAVSNMIREDRVHQIPQAMQTARAQGMQLMDDALAQLVVDQKVEAREAVGLADDRSKILRLEV